VRRQSTDLTGLALLRALVAREQRALGGASPCLAGSTTGSTPPVGRLAMAVGTKTPPTPGRGGGSSYTSDDPEQERIAALVTLAQLGDGEAFGQIYDAYVDSVYRYLYYRVGSPQLAEDLTSETFVRALRRIDSFHWQGKDIGAWFVTIARNLVADHFKSSRFKLEMSTGDILDADHTGSVNQGSVAPGTEEIVLDRLRDAELLGAVKQLKADQQECVVLRFLQGLSVAETADVMGRSQGAIKQLQLRAVRSLAKVLAEPAP
jgi:RNA polymerase sigma-70 factor (ECF subfamily)